jgi:uncharacterized protein (DUF305 family)
MTLPCTPRLPRRLALLAATLATLAPTLRAHSATPNQEGQAMTSTPPKVPNKIPRPPQSTLDLQENADHLRLMLSVAYTGQADRDVAALLAVQLQALAKLARIGLAHGSDPELRALAQRVADSAEANHQAVQAWKQRQPKE